MKILSIFSWLLLSVPVLAWTKHFDFESLPMPEGIDPQIGALQALEDGRIVAAFHRGEVMFYDPETKQWSLFATGLHEPLGMLVEDELNILVMQRAELTRLTDLDGDGIADRYATVFDDFGMTGNYHEFAYGPARDADGNLYIALGLASNGGPIREEIRGEWSEIGRLSREEMTNPKEWGKIKGRAGRMYGRTPYRGWVLRISADGSQMEPYASGFRSPNGIGFDANGRLLVTDNQGDWRPTSPLYSVEKGRFYGNPASLVWKDGWDGSDPDLMKPAEIKAMHHEPPGYFAQGELANSPTEPVVMPHGSVPSWLAGHTLVGEMNQPTLVRVLEDEVGGVLQMALLPMFDRSPLGMGNNRITFGKDGSIYVGKTALSWPGSNGITRIKWKGSDFFALERIKALPGGFALRFTEEIDADSLKSLVVKRHTYHFHAAYGSPKVDESNLTVERMELAADGRTVTLKLGEVKESYLHLIDMGGVRSKGGDFLLGSKAWYHVVKSPD